MLFKQESVREIVVLNERSMSTDVGNGGESCSEMCGDLRWALAQSWFPAI